MTLTREERSKINKANRAKGYRVERNDVLHWRKLKIFAFRIPTKQQRGDFATWDVVVCDSRGIHVDQCKDRKALMNQLEKENHIRTCSYYGLIPMICYRVPYKGLRWEILTL